MREKIIQNGQTLLQGNEGSLKVIFNNLIGKNIKGIEYQNYQNNIAFKAGFKHGKVLFMKDSELIETGIIKK